MRRGAHAGINEFSLDFPSLIFLFLETTIQFQKFSHFRGCKWDFFIITIFIGENRDVRVRVRRWKVRENESSTRWWWYKGKRCYFSSLQYFLIFLFLWVFLTVTVRTLFTFLLLVYLSNFNNFFSNLIFFLRFTSN